VSGSPEIPPIHRGWAVWTRQAAVSESSWLARHRSFVRVLKAHQMRGSDGTVRSLPATTPPWSPSWPRSEQRRRPTRMGHPRPATPGDRVLDRDHIPPPTQTTPPRQTHPSNETLPPVVLAARTTTPRKSTELGAVSSSAMSVVWGCGGVLGGWTAAQCVADGVSAGVQPGLGEQVVDVGFDGGFADEKPVGDLAVA
jgi:hypothetical protein